MKNNETLNPTTFGVRSKDGYHELFNLYGENNLQLEIGDYCFFLLTGQQKYYFPVILEGLVLAVTCGNGQERLYYITPTNIVDDEKLITTALCNQQFMTYPFQITKDKIPVMKNTPKPVKLTTQNFLDITTKPSANFFNTNNIRYTAFPVNAFFVRGFDINNEQHKEHMLEVTKKFRREYVEYFKQDTLNIIREIDFILST